MSRGALERRLPSTTISPPWIASSRLMQRISVLLPLPLGPQTTTTSPRPIVRSICWSTCSLPNHLSTFWNSTIIKKKRAPQKRLKIFRRDTISSLTNCQRPGGAAGASRYSNGLFSRPPRRGPGRLRRCAPPLERARPARGGKGRARGGRQEGPGRGNFSLRQAPGGGDGRDPGPVPRAPRGSAAVDQASTGGRSAHRQGGVRRGGRPLQAGRATASSPPAS